MKRTIKGTLTALITATTMIVGMGSVTASAYNYSEPWETYHTEAGAPVYSGVADNVSIVYSTKGSTCYQHHAGSNADKGTGYLYISSTNGTMSSIKMYRDETDVECKPTYDGAIPCASYSLRAYSQTSGATYSCDGNMATNT